MAGVRRDIYSPPSGMDPAVMDRPRGYKSRLRIGGFVAALLAVTALAPATALAEPPEPGDYQENDGLGFRNIVPPGQNGFATSGQLLQFLVDGTRPPHNSDQLDEYSDLVYASPGIGSGVDDFFKDASFGVPASDTGAVEYTPNCAIVSAPSANSPHCGDVTIVRDSAYGVPHIYGADRPAAMFAAGYVGAEDRLFFMDVERHLGRADLSSFLGGSNASTDASIWRQAPYNEADLQAQYDDLDQFQGADGAQVQEDVLNYVDGINQYIAEARVNAAKMPGEYSLALGDNDGPDAWQVTDIVATASLVAGQFGKGGGNEVGSALVLEKAEQRFGSPEGLAVWEDFREQNDAEAPLTVHDGTSFPYGTPSVEPEGYALPDPGSTQPEPVVQSPSAKAPAASPPMFKGLLDLQGASNALLVSDAESEGDHPIAVMGPQVGYYSPQILTELDIHAPTTAEDPGVDARGVGFAGINMYVLLGRGQDYAWSATSAGQDITDTYAVRLCDPENPGDPGEITDDGYMYDGTCEPFEVLERVNSWQPTPADSTPAGTQTLRALRTKLGIVTHRATLGTIPVAYTQLRATYMHEADSAVGFADFNSPDSMDNAAEFEAAASKIDYTFNWFYADSEDISYFNSGANPDRPAGVDPNLPTDGNDLNNLWEGFDPDTVTFNRAPASEHPQVTYQDYISSWNNKQAKDYSAADDTYSYGPVHRVDSLDERIEAGIAGAETMSRAELVDAMEDAATVDLRGSQVLPELLRVVKPQIGKLDDGKKLKKAIKTLEAWSESGAHRLDADADGAYDAGKAVRIMDAWWPRAVKAQFKPTLGGQLYNQIQAMMGLDDPPGAGGSAYISGWYGYADKDLRTILGDPVDDPYSRTYCGGGKLKQCRKDLQKSLSKALKHSSAKDLYPGHPNDACQELDPVPTAQWCHDSIRATAIGAITQPPIHWQNRPTFQQVAEPVNVVP
jgi:acyl-homoserine lactone acylase PvdQ